MRLWLTSLAIFAEFLAIVTASSLRGRRDSPTSLQDSTYEAGNDVCVKPECYDIASRIKQSMKLEINPCDDFYEYTCGNFGTHAKSVADMIMRNIDISTLQFHFQMKSLFESDDEIDDIEPFKQARTLYKSCTHEEAFKPKGAPLLKAFTQAFGGWPVVEGDSWNESNFDWMETIADWHRVGWPLHPFIDIRMQVDKENTSQHKILLNIPQYSETILDAPINDSIRTIHALSVDGAVSLGVDRTKAEEELMEVLQLRFRLEEVKDATIGKSKKLQMTLKELIERYPSVNWRNILATRNSPMQRIPDTDVVLVSNPMFIDQVIRLLSTTPKRVQANFAMFQLILDAILYSNLGYTGPWQKLITGIYDSSRFEGCLDTMEKEMPLIIAVMYMRKFFTPDKKKYTEDLIRKMKQEFRANLDEVSFLDNETRAFAKEKESAIKEIIGYPEDILTDDNLNDYYRGLEFLENEYLINYLRLKKFNYEKTTTEILRPSNKIDPSIISTLFDNIVPFFDSDSNTIKIPAHILQPVLFDVERPDYMNFGTLGTMLGFEVTEAFGTRKNWWTAIAKQDYDEHMKCFSEQYGKYVIDKEYKPLDVAATLDGIAHDNAGVKMAYRAYVNKMRGKVPEKRLPGLEKSPNQMFWIAYANIYCDKENATHWSTDSENDNHPPPHARIVETLSNSKEFAKDFKCPLGSRMNPIKKCSVW